MSLKHRIGSLEARAGGASTVTFDEMMAAESRGKARLHAKLRTLLHGSGAPPAVLARFEAAERSAWRAAGVECDEPGQAERDHALIARYRAAHGIPDNTPESRAVLAQRLRSIRGRLVEEGSVPDPERAPGVELLAYYLAYEPAEGAPWQP